MCYGPLGRLDGLLTHNEGKEFIVQMKSLAFGIALLVGVVSGPAVLTAEAAPINSTTTVESKTIYAAKSAEAASVLEWVKARSPEFASTAAPGDITVRLKQVSPKLSARSASSPPVPLPSNGQEGEEVTITNRQADGTIETWAYTWMSGQWVLVEYHWKGYNPENVK